MGEFEEEVRKRLTILHDCAKKSDSTITDAVTKIADMSFVPILDKIVEAKKEFPLDDKELDINWEKRSIQTQRAEDIIKTWEWFVKWFGKNGK